MENQTPEVPQSPAPITPETPPQQQPGQPVQAPSSGLAVAAMVVGIVAFFSGWVPLLGFIIAVVAIILSIIALRKGSQKGMAITGLVTGGLGLIWSLIVGAIFIYGIMVGVASYNEAVSGQDQTQHSQNSEEDAKEEVSIEDQEITGGYQVMVNKVTRDASVSDEPDNPKKYMIVNMTIKNVSSSFTKVTSLAFTLNANLYYAKADTTKVLYSGRVQSEFAAQPSLVDAPLAQGETITGNFVFEQPPKETPIILIYSYVEREGDKPVSKEKKFDLAQYY